MVRQLPCTNLNSPPTSRQIYLYMSAIMALTYLKKYEKDINLKIWDTDIDPINAK